MRGGDLLVRALEACGLFILGVVVWRLAAWWTLARAKRLARLNSAELSLVLPGRAGILLFGSAHCAPCVHAQAPAARSLVREFGDRVQLKEVDVDEEPELAKRYGVMSLPTVLVFDNRGVARRVFHGLVSIDALRRELAPLLSS